MDKVVICLRPSILLLLSLIFFSACSQDSGSDAREGEQIVPITGMVSDSEPARLFSLIDSSHSGLNFINVIEEDEHVNYVVCANCYSGGGVAIGDVDDDGLPDVFLVSNLQANRLFRNLGNFKFEDITKSSGLGNALGWANGVSMADVNGDGLLDIYVSRGIQFAPESMRHNQLFINQGNAKFREAAAEFGLDDRGYSVHSTFFDYDLDGDLDMYLINRPNVKLMEEYDMGKRMMVAEDPYVRDQLFRNEGGTHFTNVSEDAGIYNCAYGLSVAAGDFNSDGYPDLFVANDFVEHDYLYMNQGDGTFRDEVHERMKHISNFSMGADAADFNNDGEIDIYVVDMVAEDNYRNKVMMGAMSTDLFNYSVKEGFHLQYMANMLHLNSGVGDFQEIAQLAGINKTDWSWAVLFADYDLDGWKDIYVSNGNWRDSRHNDFVREAKSEYFGSSDHASPAELFNLVLNTPQSRLKNYVFRNNADLTFSDARADWGIEDPSFSNGAAYGDLDGDGDLDLVVNNVNDAAFLYRNNAVEQQVGHYLRVRLHGPGKNSQGLGARVILRQGDAFQTVELTQSRGYLSSVEPLVFFGLQSDANIDELRVIWPGGVEQTLQNVKVDQTLSVEFDATAPRPANPQAARLTHDGRDMPALMQEVHAKDLGITTVHHEVPFDDYASERLLPHRMSQNGPGLAVGDVNADGLEDFYLGAATGSAGQLYLQNSNGSFAAKSTAAFAQDAGHEDMGALFFDADGDADLDLYVVSGSGEFSEGDPRLRDRLYMNHKGEFTRVRRALPKESTSFSGSCVVAGDVDADGDLDLFIGGRSRPGHYPMPAQSALLRNDGGTYTDVTQAMAPELSKPGLVTAAVWTDFNSDGQLDLIVVGEWMPIRVFRNHNGRLVDYSSHRDLHASVGWWHSIAPADVDNDGDIDYIVGNLGKNAKYKASHSKPLHVYLNDFDQSGTQDIVLAYHNSNECYPVRGRECSSEQMPFVSEKFETYDAFASATISDVYGSEALESALHYAATEFRSCILINEHGTEFSLEPLPVKAQMAPVFGIVTDDINQDGNIDVILSGNNYSQETETVRYDAFRGAVLLGQGDGSFTVQPPKQSGLHLDGDAKSLALLRSVNNSTLMLAGMNSAAPRVYRYQAQGGKTVTLEAHEHSIRLDFGEYSQLVELPHGASYLSAGSRSIKVPESVKSVYIIAVGGKERKLRF